jgi:hypothetical protein
MLTQNDIDQAVEQLKKELESPQMQKAMEDIQEIISTTRPSPLSPGWVCLPGNNEYVNMNSVSHIRFGSVRFPKVTLYGFDGYILLESRESIDIDAIKAYLLGEIA